MRFIFNVKKAVKSYSICPFKFTEKLSIIKTTKTGDIRDTSKEILLLKNCKLTGSNPTDATDKNTLDV